MYVIAVIVILSLGQVYSDYTYYESLNLEYKVHNERVTWYDAITKCQKENATLAMPRDKKDADTMTEIFRKLPTETDKTEGQDYIFVGFHDVFNDGNFVSLQDEPIAELYHQWTKNRITVRGSCGVMDLKGELYLIGCDSRKPFICQKSLDEMDEIPKYQLVDGTDEAYTLRNDFVKLYKIHTTSRTWNDARDICHAEGGNLAIPRNAEEFNFIQSLMQTRDIPYKQQKYYIISLGLHDYFREGTFMTVLGESFNTVYNNWGGSEPEGGLKENCVGIKTEKGYRDYKCGNRIIFICEMLK